MNHTCTPGYKEPPAIAIECQPTPAPKAISDEMQAKIQSNIASKTLPAIMLQAIATKPTAPIREAQKRQTVKEVMIQYINPNDIIITILRHLNTNTSTPCSTDRRLLNRYKKNPANIISLYKEEKESQRKEQEQVTIVDNRSNRQIQQSRALRISINFLFNFTQLPRKESILNIDIDISFLYNLTTYKGISCTKVIYSPCKEIFIPSNTLTLGQSSWIFRIRKSRWLLNPDYMKKKK